MSDKTTAEAQSSGRADGKHWLDGFAGAEVAAPAAPFGIIDPDYARIFTKARILAWSYGYACVAHGSFTRDLDLLLVPWTEQATPDSAKRIIRMLVDSCDLRMDDKPEDKPHGRRAYSLHLKGFGEPRWVDVSIIAASQAPGAGGEG